MICLTVYSPAYRFAKDEPPEQVLIPLDLLQQYLPNLLFPKHNQWQIVLPNLRQWATGYHPRKINILLAQYHKQKMKERPAEC